MHFESMVLPGSRQLEAARKNLNYKLFPHNDADRVNRLASGLQEIVASLQAIEIAYEWVAAHSSGLPQ